MKALRDSLSFCHPRAARVLGFYLRFFFFNDTPPTEIYTLSLHDALPISQKRPQESAFARNRVSVASRSATLFRRPPSILRLPSQHRLEILASVALGIAGDLLGRAF